VAQQGLQSCHGLQEEEASVEKIQAVVLDGEILPRQEDVYESKYIYNFRKIDILCKPERSAS